MVDVFVDENETIFKKTPQPVTYPPSCKDGGSVEQFEVKHGNKLLSKFFLSGEENINTAFQTSNNDNVQLYKSGQECKNPSLKNIFYTFQDIKYMEYTEVESQSVDTLAIVHTKSNNKEEIIKLIQDLKHVLNAKIVENADEFILKKLTELKCSVVEETSNYGIGLTHWRSDKGIDLFVHYEPDKSQPQTGLNILVDSGFADDEQEVILAYKH